MRQTRRNWLKGTGVALFGTAVAGCSGAFEDDESGSTPDTDGDDQSTATATETGSAGDKETATGPDPTDVAVVAEWNAIRTRLRDPVILGHGEEFAAGASVAADIFERFEKASGEHNAHETLEETNETHYAGFEEGLADLRGALEAEDLDGAHEAMHAADEHLRKAQGALAGSEAVKPLSMLVMGAHVADAALLASIGDFSDAAGEFTQIGTKFNEKGMGEMLAGADTEAAEAFTDAVDRAAAAAEDEDAAVVAEHAGAAFDAVTGGSYSLLPETVAGVAHLGAIQARGWDAAALASLGGPGTDFAHAATLATYRARVHDAAWLYERGHADAAKTRVENVFAHFEGARAHEALEDASEDAYHRFEDDGLGALTTAIDEDDADGVAETVETTDAALVEGVEALGSGVEPALLEAGYFKARVEDALERYRLGEGAVAAETVRGLFETFEANEADFHETLEETDESLYETFEEDHLDGLVTAFKESDDAAVEEHVTGIREALLSFETAVGSTAQVSAVESAYMSARVFDAGVLDVVGESERAASVVESTFAHFEAGAGGFHEALEAADHDRYESFEAALDGAADAAGEGGDVTERARAFDDEAIEATYAVVGAAGGSYSAEATAVVQDTFAHFEEARVHDMLEEADKGVYEEFETALDEYASALESGSDVDAAAERFGTAAVRAQFAVGGAPGAAPAGDSETGGEEPDLEGGPNVVEGVPDDADHVVEMRAVAFEPAELTVEQGDTVAWKHAAGEPHNVVAYADELPDGATYWASGGFESEDAAREGWENGRGAVQSGQSYVHTFETAGEHEYFCVPHEAAGMVGTVVVE